MAFVFVRLEACAMAIEYHNMREKGKLIIRELCGGGDEAECRNTGDWGGGS